MRRFGVLSLLGLSLLAATALFQTRLTALQEVQRDVPYVPTAEIVVDEMLRVAQVGKDDVVYDLGCGDGRIVITAAKRHGARGVGVDIDPRRIKESNENARKAGVTDRVKFHQQDLFKMEFKDATVVTLYLLPQVNLRLRPRLLNELRPGTRIVSHDFSMDDWRADETLRVKGPSREHTVYFWVIPAKAEGTWAETSRGDSIEIRQKFQDVTGTLRTNGQAVPITRGSLAGETLTFTAVREANGQRETHTFRGRVRGDRLEGKIETEGAGERAFNGTRRK
jgi:SAM-dependent methyltransferase